MVKPFVDVSCICGKFERIKFVCVTRIIERMKIFHIKKNHKLFLPIILFLSRDAVQPRHVIFVICPGGSISEIVDKSNENSSLHESPENYPPLDDH